MKPTRLSGMPRRHLAVVAVLALAHIALAPPPRAPAGLVVRHAARVVAPGEVVLITVSASGPLSAVAGQAFGHPLAAFATEDPSVWQALVGIDLATAPGVYPVTIDARRREGARLTGVHQLTVKPKTFGVRRLRVPEQFVTPPPSALARIEREQKLLSQVLSRVSASRFWHQAFAAPAEGAPVSSFGVRSEYNGKQGTPHRGTDFAGHTGAPVRAPNAGRIVLAADLYYSGRTVVVDHGLGLFSLLAHLSRIDVRDGDLVVSGAVVGAIGATGRVTGPHLHWSVRLGPTSVDPLSLLAVTRPEKVSGTSSAYGARPSS